MCNHFPPSNRIALGTSSASSYSVQKPSMHLRTRGTRIVVQSIYSASTVTRGMRTLSEHRRSRYVLEDREIRPPAPLVALAEKPQVPKAKGLTWQALDRNGGSLGGFAVTVLVPCASATCPGRTGSWTPPPLYRVSAGKQVRRTVARPTGTPNNPVTPCHACHVPTAV